MAKVCPKVRVVPVLLVNSLVIVISSGPYVSRVPLKRDPGSQQSWRDPLAVYSTTAQQATTNVIAVYTAHCTGWCAIVGTAHRAAAQGSSTGQEAAAFVWSKRGALIAVVC